MPDSGQEATAQSSTLRVCQQKVPGGGRQSETGEPFQMRNRRADSYKQRVLLNGIVDRTGRKGTGGTAAQSLGTG